MYFLIDGLFVFSWVQLLFANHQRVLVLRNLFLNDLLCLANARFDCKCNIVCIQVIFFWPIFVQKRKL